MFLPFHLTFLYLIFKVSDDLDYLISAFNGGVCDVFVLEKYSV